ncbi:MAG TPA: hypothetical protein VF407_21390 [Polyangiaceae bacterium]
MDSRIGALGLASLLLVACGGAARYPLAAPLTKDPDQKPFAPPPDEYESPFAWDGANQIVFRPISRFFAVDPAGRATNVNAFDEVPDSSWFTNRIGVKAMTAEDVAKGSCDDKVLDPANAEDGSWIIDQGKDNGANPGFRVNIPKLGKFMLKTDPEPEPDRATGATAIASRFYHAAGYWSACDSVVYFKPQLLKLKPGLKVTDNSGVTKPFDQKALDKILKGASHRNGLVRMVASKWLPGKTIGPYKYEGTRDDDPNDVVNHEDRRELRGGRLLAAWLNHFDTREQNTMDTFLSADSKNPKVPGYVRHYIIDMGDCFGSVWDWDPLTVRLGFAYYLDIPYLAEDFVTLGTHDRPWDHPARVGGTFNFFSARDFDPELWRGGYPNPAFGRMTEQDGAWMARILARFTDDLVASAVQIGQYTDDDARYLTQTLLVRRDAILRRYLTRVSPIADVHLEGDAVCGTDLARKTHVIPDEQKSFSAIIYAGKGLKPKWRLAPEAALGGNVCVALPHVAPDGGAVDDDPSRYVAVDLANGYAHGPLRTFLYDLGPRRGFRLVGIERPEIETH